MRRTETETRNELRRNGILGNTGYYVNNKFITFSPPPLNYSILTGVYTARY